MFYNTESVCFPNYEKRKVKIITWFRYCTEKMVNSVSLSVFCKVESAHFLCFEMKKRKSFHVMYKYRNVRWNSPISLRNRNQIQICLWYLFLKEKNSCYIHLQAIDFSKNCAYLFYISRTDLNTDLQHWIHCNIIYNFYFLLFTEKWVCIK